VRAVSTHGMYESPYKPQPDASVPGRKMVPPLHKQSATETVTSFREAGTGYCAVIAGQATVTTAHLHQ